MSGPITVLSSADPGPGVPWLRLGRDDVPAPGPQDDVTAHSALHWAPLRHQGFRRRMATLGRWLDDEAADLLVSDVSVEVLALARLLSVPSVAVAMRGDRLDAPHALGYDLASHIVAPWPESTQQPWPPQWLERTTWVGPISRHDARAVVRTRCETGGRCVLLLLGRGGDAMRRTDLVEAAGVPDTHWHVAGDLTGNRPAGRPATLDLVGWLDDPWPYLCQADVVVATAGNNAIADAAAARKPLVAVPQPRPFGEQESHARTLVSHGLAVLAEPWPDRRAWPDLLDQAMRLGGAGWARYHDGGGAQRMATALEEWSRA
ncbi:hypothetical protein GCM10023145_36100 [Angustibacter luteus]